jgi:hypothetical protein
LCARNFEAKTQVALPDAVGLYSSQNIYRVDQKIASTKPPVSRIYLPTGGHAQYKDEVWRFTAGYSSDDRAMDSAGTSRLYTWRVLNNDNV